VVRVVPNLHLILPTLRNGGMKVATTCILSLLSEQGV
jgi:hypothetical protein